MQGILNPDLAQLQREFDSKKPYRFAELGGLFDPQMLLDVSREIDEHISSIPQEKNIYASYKKHKQSSLDAMPPRAKELVSYLNAGEFISRIEEITGIKNLQGDPNLLGGGIHAIGVGGFLKLHTDFNWHPGLSMHRRVNLLVYLNEGWDTAWHGEIELWDDEAKNRLFQLEPRLGNALIFESNDISYHGHPEPLACPPGVFRKSIAIYYYSPDRPDADVRFGRSEMTNYVERPGESFSKDGVRRLRHKLHLKAKALFHKFSKSH